MSPSAPIHPSQFAVLIPCSLITIHYSLFITYYLLLIIHPF
jgi:hypothetical protein